MASLPSPDPRRDPQRRARADQGAPPPRARGPARRTARRPGPRELAALEALPGVGHRQASVVMAQAFGVPAFPHSTPTSNAAPRVGLSDGSSGASTETRSHGALPARALEQAPPPDHLVRTRALPRARCTTPRAVRSARSPRRAEGRARRSHESGRRVVHARVDAAAPDELGVTTLLHDAAMEKRTTMRSASRTVARRCPRRDRCGPRAAFASAACRRASGARCRRSPSPRRARARPDPRRARARCNDEFGRSPAREQLAALADGRIESAARREQQSSAPIAAIVRATASRSIDSSKSRTLSSTEPSKSRGSCGTTATLRRSAAIGSGDGNTAEPDRPAIDVRHADGRGARARSTCRHRSGRQPPRSRRRAPPGRRRAAPGRSGV